MNSKENITHFELCQKTAEWQIKKKLIVLYEYQSYSTDEFPDVLCFKNGHTELYEIKIHRGDFMKDKDKSCRIQRRIKYFPQFNFVESGAIKNVKWNDSGFKEFISQAPHLGRKRFYVCPPELIQPDEINNGFGLYWYNGKFLKKKDSKTFKANIYDEMRILEHAFRKHWNGHGENILVSKYKK